MTYTKQTELFSSREKSSQFRWHKSRENISRLSTAKVSLASREVSELENLDPLVADAFIKLALERGLNFDDFFLRQINDHYERADELDRKLFIWKLNSIANTREQVALLANELKKS